MAQYDDFGAAPVAGGSARGQMFINATGAAVSLALVGGMAVWGYKLMVRDVSGVPVIEAIEGAFRTQPEDPGGMTAAHQGLAVNEIAATGTASPAPDAVHLAPTPTTLDEEDWPWGQLIEVGDQDAQAGSEPNGTMAAGDAIAGGDEAVAQSDPSQTSVDDPTTLAMATESDSEAPLETEATPANAIDRALAEALGGIDMSAEPETASATQDSASPAIRRPIPRPLRNLVRTSAPAATAPVAVSAGASEEIDIASLSRGTRLVQLGAFVSEDIARTEWDAVVSRFPDYFDGKRRVVQQSVSGGKTFYRLRAEGFTDHDESRRFCTALSAKRVDCIPVEVR